MNDWCINGKNSIYFNNLQKDLCKDILLIGKIQIKVLDNFYHDLNNFLECLNSNIISRLSDLKTTIEDYDTKISKINISDTPSKFKNIKNIRNNLFNSSDYEFKEMLYLLITHSSYFFSF